MDEDSDLGAIHSMHTDEYNRRYIGKKAPAQIGETKEFIQNINRGIKRGEWLYWAIENQETQQLVGTICLWNISYSKESAEIGYELASTHQGKGVMREIIPLVLNYGYTQLDVQSIEAYTRRENSKSLALLHYFGFKQVDQKSEQTLSQFVLERKDWIAGDFFT